MLAETLRDHAFIIAWFGLMVVVWFGWAQEDPPKKWRGLLGAGSVLGLVLAGTFTFGVVRLWDQDSALDGQFHIFGIVVALEVLVAAAGAVYLALKRRMGWVAWWVALVVGLHFVPLAFLLNDPGIAVLGVLQVIVLACLLPRLRRSRQTTSWLVGLSMGLTFLAFALVSAVLFLSTEGLPWQ